MMTFKCCAGLDEYLHELQVTSQSPTVLVEIADKASNYCEFRQEKAHTQSTDRAS